MATLTYAGIGLRVARLHHYSRRPIWDGPNLLYFRHLIVVDALWNPAATSFNLTDPNNLFGLNETLSQPPARTDEALRWALMQPRRKLVFSAGDFKRGRTGQGLPIDNEERPNNLKSLIVNPLTAQGLDGALTASPPARQIILESPPPQFAIQQAAGTIQGKTVPTLSTFTTDANNGPIPLYCDVFQIDGMKTFRVRYAIQTDVNAQLAMVQDPRPGGAQQTIFANACLSWLFAQNTSTNELGYSTLRTTGRAIFRTDLLEALNLTPDDFRYLIVPHPVPYGYKRTHCQVDVTDDNVGLDYQLVDEEQATCINYSNPAVAMLAKIKASGFVAFDSEGGKEFALRGFEAAGNALKNALGIGGGLANFAGKTMKAIAGVYAGCTVECWGNPDAQLPDLAYIAEAVAQERFPAIIPGRVGIPLFGIHARQDFSLTEPYFRLTITAKTGPLNNFGALFDSTGLSFPDLLNFNSLKALTSKGQTNQIGVIYSDRTQDLFIEAQQFGQPVPNDPAFAFQVQKLVSSLLRDPNTPYSPAVSGKLAPLGNEQEGLPLNPLAGLTTNLFSAK